MVISHVRCLKSQGSLTSPQTFQLLLKTQHSFWCLMGTIFPSDLGLNLWKGLQLYCILTYSDQLFGISWLHCSNNSSFAHWGPLSRDLVNSYIYTIGTHFLRWISQSCSLIFRFPIQLSESILLIHLWELAGPLALYIKLSLSAHVTTHFCFSFPLLSPYVPFYSE